MAHRNVLITSAGRRTSLVRAFREALADRGGAVLAADVDGLAPALFQADQAFRVPRINDSEYLDVLADIVKAEQVGLLVPTLDPELPVYARARDRFASLGCTVLISSPSFVETVSDKWSMVVEFAKHDVRVPRSWVSQDALRENSELPERLFVKPRNGSASQNAFPVDKGDLREALRGIPNPIVQDRLRGREITVDALLDFRGTPLHYVPRERIRTLAGESIQGVTLTHGETDRWIESVLHVCSRLGACGPLTLQAFLTADGPVLSEINPRFGGGAPLAFAAGGNYPQWILQLLEGQTVPTMLGNYQESVFFTRYMTEIFAARALW